jgi:hypothetical protein
VIGIDMATGFMDDMGKACPSALSPQRTAGQAIAPARDIQTNSN